MHGADARGLRAFTVPLSRSARAIPCQPGPSLGRRSTGRPLGPTGARLRWARPPRSSSRLLVAATVDDTLENMKPHSPTIMPASMRGKYPVAVMPAIIIAMPHPTARRPLIVVARNPSHDDTLPAAGAASKAASVVGAKNSPVFNGR